MESDASRPRLDLPAGTPLFESLRRIQTRTADNLPTQVFPQSQTSVEAWLKGVRLREADSAAFVFYLPEWRHEALGWSDSLQHSLNISPLLELGWHGETQADSNDGSRLAGIGGTLYGSLGPRLTFYSRGMVFTEYTDKAQFGHQFNPEFGETYSVEKGMGDSLLTDRTYNRFECYLLANLPWGITLKAGRDRIHTGPGYFSSLIATRNTPPYWLTEARIDFAPWLFLDNYLLRMTDTRHEIQKYANIHRFEFRPSPRLSLSFQDIVIYQDRDPDWRYALPLVPLTFTESDMGGPDNSAMGFDFLYTGFRNLSVWGELFIDDLMGPTSFFDDFWENRWAGLAGLQVTSPLPWLDADLVVEYSHVEPWTYNGRQAQTSFKHFNVPSASRLGPDSRTWDTQLSYRPKRWLELRQRLEFSEKGLGRSGILGAVHVDSLDGLEKDWLGGATTKRRIWRQEARALLGQFVSASADWAMDFKDMDWSRGTIRIALAW